MPGPVISVERALIVRVNATLNNATPEFTALGMDEVRIPGKSIDLKTAQDHLDQEADLMQPGQFSGVAGDKSAEISFTTHLEGVVNGTDSSAGLTGSEDPDDVDTFVSALLQGAGFDMDAQPATTTAGTPTGTSIQLTSATGYYPDLSVVIAKSTANLIEVRPVTALSTDTVTVAPTFSFSPAASAAVYGAKVFRLAHEDEHSQEFVHLHKNGSAYRMTGARATLEKIEATVGKPIVASWKVMARDWDTLDTDGSTDLTTVFDPADADWPELGTPRSILGNDITVIWGSTTFTTTACSVEPGVEMVPQVAQVANGKTGYFCSGKVNPTISFGTYRRMTLLTDFKNKTVARLMVQFGSTPGNVVIAYMPAAEIVEFPGEVDVNGNIGHQLKFRGTVNIAMTDALRASTGLQRVPPLTLFLA